MRVGDLVWSKWESSTMGIIVKVSFEDNIGEVCYRIRWLDSWTRESLEFEDDLLTKEEICETKKT